jgi:hypothetical protein
MDVKFWGPSGWELLHLITVTTGGLKEKKELFSTLDEILPCKYCRQSAEQFIKEDPPSNNIAVWLYDFHDKVNQKLHKQHLEDPNIPEPQKSPSFTTILKKFQNILKERTVKYPGKEFLLSVALNFDKKANKQHEIFWLNLLKLYPYYELRKKLFMPDFNHYFRDVEKMFDDMGSPTEKKEISRHKSACNKKGGSTCRNINKRK